MTHKIMVVDDEPANLRLLERLFRRDYQVITAGSGEEALRLLDQHDAALLVTDQRMPGMTGIELLKRTAEFRPHMVRIILTGYTDVEALVEAINCGQVYKYVTKPWDNDELRQTVARAVEHYETNRSRHELEIVNRRLSKRLNAMTRAVVRSISDALEAKDGHVYGHARRVGGYSVAVGRRLHLSGAALEQLSLAALLHDVGKIATPDHILLKPAALTEEERAIVRLHSERGARLLAAVPEMEEVAAAVRYHHENWDGTGYPEGLAGERVPLASRIIRVADAYDAMTSPRPFRDALDHESAVARLMEMAGTQYDPVIVDAFCGLEALARIREGVASFAGGKRWLPAQPSNALRATFGDPVGTAMREPELALRVLREVNSAPRGMSVLSLEDACAQVGEVRLGALAAQPNVFDSPAWGARGFAWHGLRAAVAARLLAEKTGVMAPPDAYTLGLLHDIGEALLCSLFPEEMENLMWLETDARLEREVAAFGVDHAQVGQWILDSCGVPASLSLAVQAHHDLDHVNDPAALLLQVADAVADANDSSEMAGYDAISPDRLALLHLTRADLARAHELTTEVVGERFDGVAA